MSSHKIGSLEDFPEGKGTQVEVEGINMAVFNLSGNLYAVGNSCPHKNLPLHLVGWDKYRGADVDEEKLRSSSTLGGINTTDCIIECPWHKLEIDLETGYSPIMDVSVPTFTIELNDDEEVFIEL